MLVLQRKRDEVVVIGEGEYAITVTVVEIRDGKVKLGFDAPDDIRIDRGEVRERINREGSRR
jgi:carbon storage regulator